MVTLKFVFNKNKMALAGLTEDKLLQPMRIHAKKYSISEIEKGVFVKDGKDALCELTMFVTQMTNTNLQYIQFFYEWTLDVDGEKEDCIKETMEWFSEYGTQQISKG